MSDHSGNMVYHEDLHRSTPDWISLFTGVGMMALLGLVVDPGNDMIEPQTLGVVAALGYLLGFVLAGSRLPDMLAHLVATLFGLGVAGVAIEPDVTWSLIRAGSITELVQRNWQRVENIATAIHAGERLPDESANLGIALTLWLVGYIASWMIFRRGWYVWSVALPASILLVSLALERDQPAWPALGFTGLAIAQGVNATARSRSGRWTRSGMRTPRGIGRWSATGGVVLAGVVIAAASSAALRIPDSTQNWVTGRAQSLADQVSEQLDRLPSQNGNNPAQNNYGEFADSFTVGEGVASGDSPVALLQAVDRHYLAARRFDSYDGTGWSSTLEALPNLEGIQPFAEAPRIAFSAGQPMNLPQSVLESSSRTEGTITLYQPTGGLLLTLESHLSSSVPSSIRVGWEVVDAQIDVDSVGIDQVPLDLRTLVGLLRLATYDEAELANGVVTITDPRLRGAIDDERERLSQHYPVITTLTADPQLGVTLIAKGRLPVYTDIESVFYSGGETRPDTYEVLGLAPNITEAELSAASQEYPDYIADKYLQLPESVTPRTGALARQITEGAGASDPYSMARAIETHLRTSYRYLLESGLGPDGEDIVDYFLFEQQVGRCDHFASAMAVMLRTLGVPARIVTGLAPVEHDPAAGGFLYRGKDAHAWVEVYFPAYGWIPFEPTPSEDPLDIDRGTNAQQGPVRPTPQAAPSPEPDQSELPEPEASPAPVVFEQPPASGGDGSGLAGFPGILAPIAVAVSLLAGLLFALWKWPLRQLQPGASYFFRLQRLGAILGVKFDRTMTPGEYARRYGREHPRYSGAAFTIAEAFTDERYGPPDAASSAAERGFAGWRQLRTSILGWRPWKRKGV